MDSLLWIVIIAAIVIAGVYYVRQRNATAAKALQDSQAEARRWVERLGGQVFWAGKPHPAPTGRNWERCAPVRTSGPSPGSAAALRYGSCGPLGEGVGRSGPDTLTPTIGGVGTIVSDPASLTPKFGACGSPG